MVELAGKSTRQIAAELTARGIPNATRWSLAGAERRERDPPPRYMPTGLIVSCPGWQRPRMTAGARLFVPAAIPLSGPLARLPEFVSEHFDFFDRGRQRCEPALLAAVGKVAPRAGWLGAARRSGHHAGTACGAALHSRHGSVRVPRTNAGSAWHKNGLARGGAAWNGRRRLGTARSVVEMAQSATGSARHSRCGGAQTRQLP